MENELPETERTEVPILYDRTILRKIDGVIIVNIIQCLDESGQTNFFSLCKEIQKVF